MATIDGFYRLTGHQNCKKYLVAGSTTIAEGDLVQYKEASGNITTGATNNEVLGVALEASASGSTAPILVDEIYPGDLFQAKIETGTMATTEIGDEFDISSEDGITLTESNNDGLIKGWDGSNTDKAFVVFKNVVNSGG